MKFFAVLPALVAAVCGEAQLATLLQARAALPYAAGYLNQAAYAYGVPITALNAGPLTAGPVAAAPALPVPAVARALPVAAVPALPSVPAVPVAAVKAIAPVAAPAVSSQYQAQDEAGNIAYGYQNINSAKQETGNANGVTGSYTYADEAGVHTVNYVADAFGFRASGNNMPVAPANIPAFAPALPVAPVDTPAVAEARAAFLNAFDAVKSRTRRSAQLPALPYAQFAPQVYTNAYPGFPYTSASYAAPTFPFAASALSYAAPALPYASPALPAPYAAPTARDAVLTTIKLNPGHATFYRVD